MAYLYRHIRTDRNEVFYIGIGLTLERAYTDIGRSVYWKRVVNKTSYEVEILFDDLTWQEACVKEMEFIHLYGRKTLKTGTLVNLTAGGDGFRSKHLLSSKEKISSKKKGVALGGNPIQLLNLETGIYYDSIAEASRSCSIPRASLWNMLNGRYQNKTNFTLITA